MTPLAAHSVQFISVRGGGWHIGAPPERATPINPRIKIAPTTSERILHTPPIGQFNEPVPGRNDVITVHNHPVGQFNEPTALDAKIESARHSNDRPQDAGPVRNPQAAFDKLAKHDPEHGIIKYNNKILMDRDVNAEAFADSPRSRRPSRANLGYSAVKRKGWK